MRIDKQLLATSFFLVSVFFLFEFSDIDISVQDNFYNNITNKWMLLHEKDSILDILFYSGIKIVIIIFGISMLILYLFSFKHSASTIKEYKKGLFVVWVSILAVPLIIGILKANTNTPCPCHAKRYGGDYPYIKVIDEMPKKIVKKFKCFPAGHASGGFALMSLFFLFKSKRNCLIALFGALAIGWSMGIYKMLIGDHYLSHTIITMIMSWLIILLVYIFASFLHNGKGSIQQVKMI